MSSPGISSRNVSDLAQTLIQKLRDRGRKHAATVSRCLPSKKHLCVGRIIPYPTIAADVVSASTEFDIFATRPVQSSTIETIESAYKPIASLE